MTIGQKIAALRTHMGLSQEELSESLGVSRQSVSKWEIDQAVPQIDKIILISKKFGITTDELLIDATPISVDGKRERNKYFGTDGFRAEAGRELTSLHAYKVGRFLGWYYLKKSPIHRARIVIGKDTRRSSYMLEYAVSAGITASGADAYMLHVTTTPSISYVTRQEEFDCGIMITASHNPYYDNGIKIINRYGEKLDDETTALIEAYLDSDMAALGIDAEDIPLATRDKIGSIIDHVSGRNRYIGYLISLASNSYRQLRIGLDCANGSSWNIAKSVFGALGAKLYIIGDEPDGTNINQNCGSTHVEQLSELVRGKHLDLGFAFDGDADRCIAVDENGKTIDGDGIMYILANRLKKRGMLADDTVVTTVMSNSGLAKSLEAIGIKCVQTAVGDRFVFEEMQKRGYSLGGEQSGHIILKKYATTGDGILTAIMLTEELCDSGESFSSLSEKVTLFPQFTKNLKVKNKNAVLTDGGVLSTLREAELLMKGKGRILLRPSGTEPLIRIMVESESIRKCEEYANLLSSAIIKGGHVIE